MRKFDDKYTAFSSKYDGELSLTGGARKYEKINVRRLRRRRNIVFCILLCSAVVLTFCVTAYLQGMTSDNGSVSILFSTVFRSKKASDAEVSQSAEYVNEDGKFCLGVTNILQNPLLPNGCEAVSLAIVLRYLGYECDPVNLYEEFMPKTPIGYGNPWTDYVGDAEGTGLGCYAPCVAETGNSYLESIGARAVTEDISGREFAYYKDLVSDGVPVIVWGTTGMCCDNKICYEVQFDSGVAVWHSYSHCLVLIGYTENTYIFCDPLVGIAEYDRLDVEESFEINFKQACIVRQIET